MFLHIFVSCIVLYSLSLHVVSVSVYPSVTRQVSCLNG